MTLTDLTISKAKPREKPYKLSDEKGLFLLISPSGRTSKSAISRLWRVKYRFSGKEKLLALGSYPEVTLAEARKRREIARELLARGIDPSFERKDVKRARQLRAENTFEPIARELIAKQANRWTKRSPTNTVTTLCGKTLPMFAASPCPVTRPILALIIWIADIIG